jgi:hypothetical protein
MPLSKETVVFISTNPGLSQEVLQRINLKNKQAVAYESLEDGLKAARNSLRVELLSGLDETAQAVRGFVFDARSLNEQETKEAAFELGKYQAATLDRVRVAAITDDIKKTAIFFSSGVLSIESKAPELAKAVADFTTREVGSSRGKAN